MKKISMILLVSCLILTSCVTGTDIEARNEDGSPIWTTVIPESNRLYYGVGSSKLSNQQNSSDSADIKARADLARKLESTIKEAGAVYTSDAAGSVADAYEKITLQVVDITMRGVKVEERWSAPDGTAWSLVSFPIRKVPETMELEANSFIGKVTKALLAMEKSYNDQLIELEKAEAILKASKDEADPEKMTEEEKVLLDGALSVIEGFLGAYGADTPDGLRKAMASVYSGERARVEEKIAGLDPAELGDAVREKFRSIGYEVE